MNILTYPENSSSLSNTRCVTKKEKNIETFVKTHNITLSCIIKTGFENYSETFEQQQETCSTEYSTNIIEIPTPQPFPSTQKGVKNRTQHKKLKARLKEKITFLEKALDTYGIIDKIVNMKSNKEIHARVYDINSHEFIDEITFSSDEFSKSDQQKLVENAIFYWYVGMEKTLFGQEKRVSEFRLRRIFKQ